MKFAYFSIIVGAILFVICQVLQQKCAILQIIASGFYNGGIGFILGWGFSKKQD